MTDFDRWASEVDELCRVHLYCSWAELCGDLPPLQTAYASGETPGQFVRWWADKYDLAWRNASRVSSQSCGVKSL